jgi:hypothetical protein
MTPSPMWEPTGTIRITREPRGRRDRLRAYSVVVDSQVVAKMRPAETLDVPVAPGGHSVHIAIDWARSPALSVDVAPGETVDLRCAPNTAQSALIGITVGRGKYVRLWRAETSAEPERVEEALPVPWLRFVTLGLLLTALGISVAYGRIVDATIVALLALVPASVIGAWIYARKRR